MAFWQRTSGDLRSANGIAGGGITPRQGMRFGLSRAWGRFADATSARAALAYDLATVEADVAFGHSRLSGEWLRSRLDSAGGTRVSRGWTVQGQHAVTPRVFVHSRTSTVRAPRAATSLATAAIGERFRSLDNTVGYLVNPDVTVRVAHSALRGFARSAVDHQIGVSLVWTRRWW